ncbi:substrate-binding periplasmic protein [Pseudomonas sp. NPDC077186]|uniref:substrate-binding periplasmic protein n=1 Tax=Pseudomonas sp. NPDC077186 TaxID=3364421 RepID=UPI0037C9E2CC
MALTGWLLAGVLLLIGASGAQAQDAPPGEIRLASEVWNGHTHADGTGLAWDVLRRVFEPAGVALRIHSVPYTRSIGLVQRGEADAWVGSYRDEVGEGVFYPRWHYDADQIAALGLRDKPQLTLDKLADYRLAWMRGYGYQAYLPNVRDYREIHRRSGILGMLELGHADFYIDARTEVDDVLSEAPDAGRYRISELTRLPLYLGFADTPRGRRLAEVYDRRLGELMASGELRPLFERWQQPYPFD